MALLASLALATDVGAPAMASPAVAVAEPLWAGEPALRRAGADAYVWFSSRKERRVKVRGSVPSEEVRKTILGMVKANMPDLEIDDRMEVLEGAPDRQVWLGAVSFALVQLGQLGRGYVHLSDTRLSVEGEARSSEAYRSLHAALGSLPAGIALAGVAVVAPVAAPFTWGAQFENGALTLTGHVVDEGARAQLLRRAARLVPEVAIVDRMELASGAPEDWSAAAAAALAQLVRLEQGRVTLSDTALVIEGVARDEQLASEVARALETGLPEPFAARADIRSRSAEHDSDRAQRQPTAAPSDAFPASKAAGAAEQGSWRSWLVGGGWSRAPGNER